LDGVAIPGQTGLTLNASAAGLGAGTYTLASDFQGQCLMGLTHVIDQVRPEPAFSVVPTEGCSPLEVTFRDTTDGNVTSRTWDLGPLGTSSDATVVRTYTSPGTYDVTLTVTNDVGCTADSTLNDAIVVHPIPNAGITATPPMTDTEHTTVDLAGTGNDIVTWWWDLGAVPPNTSSEQDLTVTFPQAVGTYPVMLVVTNGFGCRDTVRSVVVVTLEGEIVMPNVFSPNGDHHNDSFIPLSYTGTPGQMEIFNRWGQLIFTTTRLATGWDGRAEGGPVPEGTYYYIVKALTDDMTVTTGHVTLVR
jgi:gliding motility-associated-like protein